MLRLGRKEVTLRRRWLERRRDQFFLKSLPVETVVEAMPDDSLGTIAHAAESASAVIRQQRLDQRLYLAAEGIIKVDATVQYLLCGSGGVE